MSNSSENNTLFCSTPLWSDNFWQSDHPELTDCFRKTILVSLAPVALIVLVPLDLRYLIGSPSRSIPWRPKNVASATLALSGLAISFVALFLSVFNFNLWSLVFQNAIDWLNFTLAFLLIVLFRRNGRRISIAMSVFWLISFLVFCYRIYFKISSQNERTLFPTLIFNLAYLVISLLSLILSTFPDEVARFRRLSGAEEEKFCPLENENVFSRLTLTWNLRIVKKAIRHKLELLHLNQICHSICCDNLSTTFSQKDLKYNGAKLNQSQVTNKKFVPVVWSVIWVQIIIALVMEIGCLTSIYFQPFLLDKLLIFLSDKNKEQFWHAILYAVGYCLAIIIAVGFVIHADFLKNVAAIRCKSALTSAIYNKIFVLSPRTKNDYTLGQITNLIAVDCKEVFEFVKMSTGLVIMPLSLVIGMYFLWTYLGPSSLVLIGMMCIVVPLTSFAARRTDRLQEKQMHLKDKRMSQISEILNGIKVIKLNAWELPFLKRVTTLRDGELKVLKQISVWNSLIDVGIVVFPVLLIGGCLIVYSLVNNSGFNAVTVFVSISIVKILGYPIGFLPSLIGTFVRATVSFRRITKYLNSEELNPKCVDFSQTSSNVKVDMDKATMAWDSKSEETTLKNIDLKLTKGALIAVVGRVGSGKSSLLAALTGELYKLSGTIRVNGSVAFVPQTAWIQNTTLKSNILFLSSFCQDKYEQVLKACALEPDLQVLPAGDQTEIGERGINLSGGQKQRVSLARAIYQNADIYLLDDPLSAVDAHVANQLFDQVIGNKGLLRLKTRILVTHQLKFLPEVDEIFVIKNGEIIANGSYQELFSSGFLTENVYETDETQDNNQNKENIEQGNVQSTNKKSEEQNLTQIQRQASLISNNATERTSRSSISSESGRLIDEEFVEVGSVQWGDYFKYISYAGPFLFAVFVLFRFGWSGSEVGTNVWLSVWTSQDSNSTSTTSIRDFNVIIYGGLIFSQIFFLFFGDILIYWLGVRASLKIHQKALQRVFRSPLSYFDVTPSGRILNRFSKDISNIDEEIPTQFMYFLERLSWFPMVYAIICFTSVYLALEIIIICLIFYVVYRVYVNASRQLRRLEAVSNSPVQNHINESVSGLSSVRAYKCQQVFFHEFARRVDDNLNSYYHQMSLWVFLELSCELLGSSITISTAIFICWQHESISPSLAGLLLIYTIEAVGVIQFAVATGAKLETSMISMERMRQLMEIVSEADWQSTERFKPPHNWPVNGNVHFQNYSTCYRSNLPPVLNDVTFEIEAGQKVGVVGRTGAGKSSLVLGLFRMIEPTSGTILIDGVDITKIGLHDLRCQLSIIPQDAVLFAGSLRYNLDPLQQYDDHRLWRALEEAHLSHFVASLSDGLDHAVSEGGENLSAGQRQLVFLARALLKNAKILVLDEATSACDSETDALIQKTIFEKFEHCTILIIAHRLDTVIGCDKVVVLSKGKVIEVGPPKELLGDRNTQFFALAREAGIVSEFS